MKKCIHTLTKKTTIKTFIEENNFETKITYFCLSCKESRSFTGRLN